MSFGTDIDEPLVMTVEHQDEHYIDEGTFEAKLLNIKRRDIKYKDKETQEDRVLRKLRWMFEVTENGVHLGKKVFGETFAEITTRSTNQVMLWSTALRGGMPYELGEQWAAGDLIELPCKVRIANSTYNRGDGTVRHKSDVVEVLEEGTEGAAASDSPWGGAEPPF